MTTSESPIGPAVEVGFEWLRLDLDRLAQKEVLEYSIKKSLLAASAVFTLEKNLSGDTLSVEGQLQAKVPFKGHFEFEATSVSRRAGGARENGAGSAPENGAESALGFSIYKEFQNDEAIRLWLEQEGVLKCLPEGEAPKREMPLKAELARAGVLNSLTLLSVLSTYLPSKCRLFAAQFVAADKLFALKIQVNEPGTVFRVFAKDIDAPVTSAEWKALAWPASAMVEGSWDADQRVVSALRVRVPVLGALELPLIRSSRE